MLEKGVLILSLGSDLYGRYAFNLAMSIKHTSPSVHITVVHSNNLFRLTTKQLAVFDNMIECPGEYYMQGNKQCFINAKLYLDLLTPYKKTLFIDADMLVSPYKSVESIFKKCDNNQFVMVCRGADSNASEWVNVDEMLDKFALKKWYDCSSEVMYFEETKVFEKAREIHQLYLNGEFYYKNFAGGVPDEACIVPAMLITTKKPKFVPFKPTYWEGIENKFMKSEQIFNNFELLSIGGNTASKHVQNIYNLLIKWYSSKSGYAAFSYENKMRIQERKLI